MKKNNNNFVYKKKHFFVIFEFFGWKTQPGLRYKHKKSNFLPQFCVFAYEKMHIVQFSYDKHFFDQN